MDHLVGSSEGTPINANIRDKKWLSGLTGHGDRFSKISFNF